jgi:hypothetical protein
VLTHLLLNFPRRTFVPDVSVSTRLMPHYRSRSCQAHACLWRRSCSFGFGTGYCILTLITQFLYKSYLDVLRRGELQGHSGESIGGKRLTSTTPHKCNVRFKSTEQRRHADIANCISHNLPSILPKDRLLSKRPLRPLSSSPHKHHQPGLSTKDRRPGMQAAS